LTDQEWLVREIDGYCNDSCRKILLSKNLFSKNRRVFFKIAYSLLRAIFWICPLQCALVIAKTHHPSSNLFLLCHIFVWTKMVSFTAKALLRNRIEERHRQLPSLGPIRCCQNKLRMRRTVLLQHRRWRHPFINIDKSRHAPIDSRTGTVYLPRSGSRYPGQSNEPGTVEEHQPETAPTTTCE